MRWRWGSVPAVMLALVACRGADGDVAQAARALCEVIEREASTVAAYEQLERGIDREVRAGGDEGALRAALVHECGELIVALEPPAIAGEGADARPKPDYSLISPPVFHALPPPTGRDADAPQPSRQRASGPATATECVAVLDHVTDDTHDDAVAHIEREALCMPTDAAASDAVGELDRFYSCVEDAHWRNDDDPSPQSPDRVALVYGCTESMDFLEGFSDRHPGIGLGQLIDPFVEDPERRPREPDPPSECFDAFDHLPDDPVEGIVLYMERHRDEFACLPTQDHAREAHGGLADLCDGIGDIVHLLDPDDFVDGWHVDWPCLSEEEFDGLRGG